MSNTDRRLPLAVAKQIAEDLVQLLEPACERIAIAGSIRRMKDDIGDVEIVCIPRYAEQSLGTDLFGNANVVRTSCLDTLCAKLLSTGVLRHRLNVNKQKSWGSDLKWGTYQDFGVDLYSATRETWGVLLAIRTGPNDFSRRLVTKRSQGGFCPDYLEVKGWRVRRRDNHQPLDTPTEEDAFRALGLEWLEPARRTDTTRPRWLQEVARG